MFTPLFNVQLFFKQPRATSVIAVNFCDIFELTKADLFAELKRRDFDLMQMLDLFVVVHEDNKRRNTAIQNNLKQSKMHGSKLNKLIDANDESLAPKRKVLDIFMPGSRFRFLWDITCTLGMGYFSIFALYRLAFQPSDQEGPSSVLLDFIIDTLFFVDVYLRSTQFAFPKHGVVSTDKESILAHYMEDGMLVDFISCLSVLDVASYKCALVGKLQLRLLCLLRTLRAPAFFNRICDHLNLRDIRISLASNLLMRIIFFYIIANHWVACIWFIIHRYFEHDHQFTWATTDCPWGGEAGGDTCLAKWDESLGEHNVCNMASMRDCYLRALHFSITTLSTVGYGDISPISELETIWENVVVLMGACFLAGIIGAFGSLLSQNDTLGLNSFKSKMQKLKEYMKYRNIPEGIQNNIIYFHHYRWKNSQTMDERETLSILPEPLQLDISFAVKERAIRLVPILRQLPTIIQKRISHALVLQSYPPESTIYSLGDIGWELYFIVSGVVTITLPTDLAELDTAGRANAKSNKEKFQSTGLMLGVGNHVGESCINSESGVRQETVSARTKAEMYVLAKDDLDNICRFMELRKASALKRSLLTRNGNVWHSFYDEESVNDAERVIESSMSEMDTGRRERQNSSSCGFFPWSSSHNNHIGQMRTSLGSNNRGTTIMRRRRLSNSRPRSFSVSSNGVGGDGAGSYSIPMQPSGSGGADGQRKHLVGRSR